MYPVPGSNAYPYAIATGADGNLWITDENLPTIDRMTPAGAVTVFAITGGAQHSAIGIAPGPDGNLWFTDFGASQVGRITTAGAIVEFDLPTASAYPYGITAGPDGNMWFTELEAGKIGRISI